MRNSRARRRLVVNADDLGHSAGINRGIFEAHERGIVTSASLMVRWPALAQAVDYAREHPSLGVGLHLDFAEWAITDDEWRPLYEVVDVKDAAAVRREMDGQLEAFRSAMGRWPTHLDSHQHLHRDSAVWPIALEMARRLGVPLRHDGQVYYCGDFYGQDEQGQPYHEGIGVAALVRAIQQLPEGVSELACHPGYAADDLATMYRHERALEVKALCDPRVREALAECDVQLITFAELKRSDAVGD